MKKDKDEKNKKAKKIFVNSLTLSRVAGTIAMPILINSLSAPVFLLVVAAILFTDRLDGILARHWEVSTIFGSLADMTADKLFIGAILIVLSTMYPIMSIPLILEALIARVNIKAAENNSIAKSSDIGRIKTAFMTISICSLLFTGLSTELLESLSNIRITDLLNNDLTRNIENGLKDAVKIISNWTAQNKETIEIIAKTSAITSETIVSYDYIIKSKEKKDSNSNKYKIAELIKNKKFVEYAKKVLLDENYYTETKDMPILEKLCPPELREEIKTKKLTLEKDNI